MAGVEAIKNHALSRIVPLNKSFSKQVCVGLKRDETNIFSPIVQLYGIHQAITVDFNIHEWELFIGNLDWIISYFNAPSTNLNTKYKQIFCGDASITFVNKGNFRCVTIKHKNGCELHVRDSTLKVLKHLCKWVNEYLHTLSSIDLIVYKGSVIDGVTQLIHKRLMNDDSSSTIPSKEEITKFVEDNLKDVYISCDTVLLHFNDGRPNTLHSTFVTEMIYFHFDTVCDDIIKNLKAYQSDLLPHYYAMNRYY